MADMGAEGTADGAVQTTGGVSMMGAPCGTMVYPGGRGAGRTGGMVGITCCMLGGALATTTPTGCGAELLMGGSGATEHAGSGWGTAADCLGAVNGLKNSKLVTRGMSPPVVADAAGGESSSGGIAIGNEGGNDSGGCSRMLARLLVDGMFFRNSWNASSLVERHPRPKELDAANALRLPAELPPFQMPSKSSTLKVLSMVLDGAIAVE